MISWAIMAGGNWTILGQKRTLRVVGLMSGTSADGIDAALVDITPGGVKLAAFDTYRYPAAVGRQVTALCDPATSSVDRICHMNFVLGELFAEAVLRLAADNGVRPGEIDLVGSHGQTICHQPSRRRFGGRVIRSTLQIGEPSVIAERTGITTVADFRPRDIAAGGQGAPLVPYADHILFAHGRLTRVLCNIGGIANVTFLPAGGAVSDLRAFDTGPGNMVIDELVRCLTRGRRKLDRDGRMARRGKIHHKLLSRLLKDPYFRRKPPKTTGREQFGAGFASGLLAQAGAIGLGRDDIVATATALTAGSIARACRKLPASPDELILCGGGARNLTLVEMLREAVRPVKVRIMDELGLSADAKEAVSFAILAAATIRGQACSVPSATGADGPAVLGKIIPGR